MIRLIAGVCGVAAETLSFGEWVVFVQVGRSRFDGRVTGHAERFLARDEKSLPRRIVELVALEAVTFFQRSVQFDGLTRVRFGEQDVLMALAAQFYGIVQQGVESGSMGRMAVDTGRIPGVLVTCPRLFVVVTNEAHVRFKRGDDSGAGLVARFAVVVRKRLVCHRVQQVIARRVVRVVARRAVG